MKTGVLLVNLGTPDSPKPSDVYTYLKQFLLDPRVIDYPAVPRHLLVRGIIVPFRHRSSAKLYQQLWTKEGSPIKVYGYALKNGVQEALGDDYIVELAMRYQNPSIDSAIDSLMDKAVDRVIVLPLFPQYASATVGSVHDEVMRIFRTRQIIPPVSFINSYYDYEPMIDVFVDHAKEYNIEEYDHVLFSYHGLPQRQLGKADNFNHCLKVENCCRVITDKNKFCYSAQCYGTTAAIVAKLGLTPDQYTVCFQSRLGREVWTQPYTSTVLEDRIAEGDKKILVFSPAFVADCLETTIEIGHEYQEEFEEKGGERLDLVESLNDDPKWIAAVADMIRAEV